MQIWLAKTHYDKFPLPINPPALGYNDSSNFEDIVLADGDERTVIGGRNLKTYSLTSFFPPDNWSGVNYFHMVQPPSFMNLRHSMDYVNKIEEWMDEKAVIQLVVTTTNINHYATIRSFTWEEKGGSVGFIDYTLELKEYKPITIGTVNKETVKIAAAKTGGKTRPSSRKETVKSYTVQKGDSLWVIAKKVYGSGSEYMKIYNANKDIIGKSINGIHPGQKLVIPK